METKQEGYVFYTKEDNETFRGILRDLHFYKGDPKNPGHKLCEPSEYFNGGTYWAVVGTESELEELEHACRWML